MASKSQIFLQSCFRREGYLHFSLFHSFVCVLGFFFFVCGERQVGVNIIKITEDHGSNFQSQNILKTMARIPCGVKVHEQCQQMELMTPACCFHS